LFSLQSAKALESRTAGQVSVSGNEGEASMRTKTTVFAIPTNRLRDVAETVEIYDKHFWSNGHSLKMIVFDDSTLANHEKYLCQARANEDGQ
jgi:hypothetical protein